MSNRHFFICPECEQPTRELKDYRCLSCFEQGSESEDISRIDTMEFGLLFLPLRDGRDARLT